jgi:uncharacterized protein YodC (DUF2158 family)
MRFKVGDVVRLKSGSPKITVVEVDGERVTCVWFGLEGKRETGTFPGRGRRRTLRAAGL